MLRNLFEKIYTTDLMYLQDCWKLCGAHCCGFEKRKPLLKLFGPQVTTELYLLPGEYQYLSDNDYLKGFGEHQYRLVRFALGEDTLKIESIVGKEPVCICEHATRTTVCRLYPLLPVFSVEGNLKGTERAHFFDEMEAIDELKPICQVNSLPFSELNKFLSITHEIAKYPIVLFYLEAFRLTKRHIVHMLSNESAARNVSAFKLFEMSFIRGTLIDHSILDQDLITLRQNFKNHYGDRFHLEGEKLVV